MREYRVLIVGEYDGLDKGVITITAENRVDMELQADAWQYKHPGYIVDCFQVTSHLVSVPEIGEVTA